MTAPSLLTKCCHDMDFLLWLMSSPASPLSGDPPHLPSLITATGNLNQFRKARKPLAAGSATNCISCPIESSCIYSAKTIYIDKHLNQGDVDWPVHVVVPEIEDIYKKEGKKVAEKKVLEVLTEDYTSETAESEVKKRAWYGRCVWECDNDVLDDQTVTMTWDDDPLPITNGENSQGTNSTAESKSPANGKIDGEVGMLNGRAAKTAIFHMIAPTEKICERRGVVYGTTGEIAYDSETISVHDFVTGKTKTYVPDARGGGHSGGDDMMVDNFCKAVQAATTGEMEAEEAQKRYLGCGIEEVVRSHVAVFAAEKARRERVVLEWPRFWAEEVEARLSKSRQVNVP
jgi:hypothetical protein